ncbi:hypothetical protein Ciccas_010533, partial [Cichlidogyrus casuarinus]
RTVSIPSQTIRLNAVMCPVNAATSTSPDSDMRLIRIKKTHVSVTKQQVEKNDQLNKDLNHDKPLLLIKRLILCSSTNHEHSKPIRSRPVTV